MILQENRLCCNANVLCDIDLHNGFAYFEVVDIYNTAGYVNRIANSINKKIAYITYFLYTYRIRQIRLF